MAEAILAGDVGGTKSHLGLYQRDGLTLKLVRDEVFSTPDFDRVEEIAARFLGTNHGVRAACLGVPGLVIRGRSHATNLPSLVIDEASLARSLGGAPTRIVNDLVATAYGMIHLEASEFATLQQGTLDGAGFNRAVIAAGTGLGEAALIALADGRFIAISSEGGHADFAPRGEEQVELLKYLAGEFGHVTFERVCSGPGLVNIHRFLRDRSGEPAPQWLAEQLAGDAPAVITKAALGRTDPTCVHAHEIFVEVYGAEASNLALKLGAWGGVYIGGGIAPKILPALQDGRFVRSFRDKGRMSEVLAKVELKVSLNPATALVGAARLAAELI
ncbi:MAG: glucokinase [Candidatus Binataceae bacterium]